MSTAFSALDWIIFIGYFAVLIVSSVWLSRKRIDSSREYFVAGNQVPMLAAAVSLLATTQSAATFLGGPEYAYKFDLTFVGFYVSAFIAVIFIAKILVPRFYAIRAVTVYELLEVRYGVGAKQKAGVMFLIGRLLASGARLYIGSLAVSMILYGDISVQHVMASIVVLMIGALAYTFFGGVRSVIYSDVIQAFVYIGAAVAVLIYLLQALDADWMTMINVLSEEHKLRLIDTDVNGTAFNLWSLMGGWILLSIAAYGLDQDMTQRVLSCKDQKAGERALYVSVIFTIPVVLLFLVIGLLLYLYYHHPELSGFSGQTVEQTFDGQSITIFMHFILGEMPEGLRALVTVGAIAAALSSTTSVLAAMASVAVEDLYRPWIQRRNTLKEEHFVKASRIGVLIFAVLLSLMAALCFYWQRYTELPLLGFALGVMTFAYSGLLGVYFSAVFTKRGSDTSVAWSLGGGFLTVLALQPYVLDITIGPAWQLLLGTFISFIIMQSMPSKESR